MTSRIFISYRREDSRGSTGRLYDQLVTYFGKERIFMDVDTIQPGLDFVEEIEKAVNQTDVQLVVIGPNWISSTDAAGSRRLDNPEDFVRLEVASALKRNIRVIPVLVDRASMPNSSDLPDDLKPLSRRNALEISHSRFNLDVQRLIPYLEHALQQAESERKGIVQMENGEEPKYDRVVTDVNKHPLSDHRIEGEKHLQNSHSTTSDKPGNSLVLYIFSFIFQVLFWLALGVIILVIRYFLVYEKLESLDITITIIASVICIGSFFGFQKLNKKLRQHSKVGNRIVKIITGLIGIAVIIFFLITDI